MTAATRNEALLLTLATGVVAWLSPRLPASLEIGALVAVAALTLLVQGGVRDVATLVRQRRRQKTDTAAPPHAAHCICLESTVGLGGVLLGVVLTALPAGGPRIALPAAFWPVAFALIGLTGLAIRDLVIQWKPRLRLLRVKDHGSIMVRFR